MRYSFLFATLVMSGALLSAAPVSASVCIETDGGYAPYATGAMTHTFEGIPSPAGDACITQFLLTEYYCSDSLQDGSHVDTFTCPFGCEDGRCLYEYELEGNSNAQTPSEQTPPTQPQEPTPEPEPTCTETDGGYAKNATGVMTHTFEGMPSPVTDICISDTELQEYYCNEALYDGSHVQITTCEYGCENGRCLYEYEYQPEAVSLSCTETDGGFETEVYGSITFQTSDGPWTAVDHCPQHPDQQGQLGEYSCDGTQPNLEYIDCPYGCEDGACQPQSCTETDGGHDVSVFGSITFNTSIGPWTAVDHCSPTTDQLGEYSCDGMQAQLNYETCPYGCEEGRCIDLDEATPLSCTDTDGGMDIYTAGTVSQTIAQSITNYEDRCAETAAGSQLTEYACDGTEITTTVSTCAFGCANGACTQPIFCTENDGGNNPTVQGTTTSIFGGPLNGASDWCAQDHLIELHCESPGSYSPSITVHDCTFGCAEGRCLSRTESTRNILLRGRNIILAPIRWFTNLFQ